MSEAGLLSQPTPLSTVEELSRSFLTNLYGLKKMECLSLLAPDIVFVGSVQHMSASGFDDTERLIDKRFKSFKPALVLSYETLSVEELAADTVCVVASTVISSPTYAGLARANERLATLIWSCNDDCPQLRRLHLSSPLPDYSGSTSANVSVFNARSAPDELFMRMINEEQQKTGEQLSLRSLLVLDALKQQRRLTVADLSAQLHITDAATRVTVEALLEAGLVEARGSSTARSYMLSGKVYSQSGKEAGYVRQSDIDKIRYPELIMKLAERQGGSVATRDVENLLHLHRKQAYRLLVKLVEDGSLVLVGRGGGAHYEITEKGWERIGH